MMILQENFCIRISLEGILPMYYQINIFQMYRVLVWFFSADLKIAGKLLAIFSLK